MEALFPSLILTLSLLGPGFVGSQDASADQKESAAAGAVQLSKSQSGIDSADDPIGNGSNLPEWISQGTHTEDGALFLVAQTSHPFNTPLEADQAIDAAVREVLTRQCAEELAGTSLIDVGVSDATVNSSLLVPGTRIVRLHRENFTGELAARYGEKETAFYRGYAQIRLDPEFRDELRHRVRQKKTRDRLLFTGLLAIGLMGLLGLIFGYLRVDHATRGFYTGRIQMISLGIGLVMVSLLCLAYFRLV